MARKVTGGLVGEPSVGAINVAPTAVVTAAQNQNITLSPLGTASVIVTNNVQLNSQNSLRFADSDSSNWVGFIAPATVTANVTWTLPATDSSVNGFALVSNASGALSWSAVGPVHTTENLSSSTFYPVFSSLTDGYLTSSSVSTTNLQFQPSTGTLTTTVLSVTGNADVGGNIVSTGSIRANVPLYLNSNTINANYVIDGSTNAVSAGPITIAIGVTVTVNGNWSVV
jgi:hypothetical protein